MTPEMAEYRGVLVRLKPTLLAAAVFVAWAALDGPARAVVSAVPAPAGAGAVLAQTDLDEFMRQVLARRDENWKKLQQYVLDEHEKIDIVGPQLARIVGSRRDYRWYIKEGYFVRSPVSTDGIPVSESERRQAEDEYLRQAKAREKRDAERARADADNGGTAPASQGDAAAQQASPVSMDGLLSQTRQPQFISTAYFLRFKFEQGKYALVGREQFDGRPVLRIEYYPARLFADARDKAARQADPGKDPPDRRQDLEVERLMNKNSLVTLWVEPDAKQIVKFVFDNVQTDFLPISWLFRLDDFKASMTMSQPFKDVWLPRDVDLLLSAMLAVGKFDIRYHLDYVDYQEASTSGRIIRGGGE
jgi:hypothetical protein